MGSRGVRGMRVRAVTGKQDGKQGLGEQVEGGAQGKEGENREVGSRMGSRNGRAEWAREGPAWL